MDKIINYRNIVKQILSQHAEYNSHQNIETIPIFDDRNDMYFLMDIGWSRVGRVHAVPIHLRIKTDRVWIEQDDTDANIAAELMDAGVPKEDIVLGFHRPARREIAGFAIG